MASNLATGVVVARVLGPSGLGVWIIFQLILSYAEAFGRPKFEVAAVYYLGRRAYDLGTVTFTLHVLALACAGLVLLLAALVFEPLYALLLGDSTDVRALFWLVLVQVPAQFLYLNYAYLQISREDVRAYNRMTLLRALLNSGLCAVLLLVFQLGLAGVVWAGFLSTLSGLGYGAALLHRHVGLVPTWNTRLIKDLAGYGGKLYVAGAVAQLNTQLTASICAVTLPPAQLAYFALASARRDIFNLLPNALNTVLLPRLSASAERLEAARLTARAVRLLLLILTAAGFAVAVFARPIVILLYGSDYEPVVGLFVSLVPGFVLYGATSPYIQYFLGTGRADLAVTMAGPPAVLQLVLAFWLVPVAGLLGAVAALLLSLVLASVLAVAVFLRVSGLPAKEALLLRQDDLVLMRDVTRREMQRLWPGGDRRRSAT